jgi:hypothetical protein
MRLPFAPTLEVQLDEGWGLPERADDPEDAVLRLPSSPAQVSRHMSALQWSADYLCPDHSGSARTVGLWAACSADGRSLAGGKAKGIPRVHTYRLQDRGLSLIVQGPTRDRVRVELA